MKVLSVVFVMIVLILKLCFAGFDSLSADVKASAEKRLQALEEVSK